MDPATIYFLTTTLVLILEQQASSAPIAGLAAAPERGAKTRPLPGLPRRVKRCSCENLKDMECVYFCHIGIVWVNTPGQVVPYGVGSYPVRLRRETGRCSCVGSSDMECLRFCAAEHHHKEQEDAQATSPKVQRHAEAIRNHHVGPRSEGSKPHGRAQKT